MTTAADAGVSACRLKRHARRPLWTNGKARDYGALARAAMWPADMNGVTLLPYWLLFSAFATGAMTYGRGEQIGRQTTPILTVLALVTAAMIGFRYDVGADWGNYMNMFYYYAQTDFYESLFVSDAGYGVINWAVTRLGLQIWAVNLVCGLILTWGIMKFAQRQPNPWLAAVVAVPYLIIVVAMGYSRQGAAIGFLLAGLAALDRGQIVRFGILILGAALFHKTSVVVIPLVAMASVRNRFAVYASMGALALLMFFVLVNGDLSRMSYIYLENEFNSDGAGVRIAMSVIPATLFLIFQRRFVATEAQRLLWRNFSYAAFFMLFLLLVMPSSTAVDRIALYLIPLQIFVLTRLPEAFPEAGKADRKLAIAVVVYCAMIQYIWLNYATHAEHWLPYRAFFISEA